MSLYFLQSLRLPVAGAAVAAVLTLSGCSDAVESMTEKYVKSQFEEAGMQFDENGELSGFDYGEGQMSFALEVDELPEDFPADVPVYQGMALESMFRNTREQGEHFMVAGSTLDDVKTVVDTLVKDASDAGWQLDEEELDGVMWIEGEDGTASDATAWLRKQDRVLNFVVSPEGEGTQITVMTGYNKDRG